MYHYIRITKYVGLLSQKINREIVLTRAIISDIDGTLIYRGHSLNKARLPLMLERLRSRNIAFCLSTGRTLGEVEAIFGDMLRGIYVSSCDGALTTVDGVAISEYPVKSYLLEYFFSFAKERSDTRRYSPSSFGIEFHGIEKSYIFTCSASLFHKEKARLKNLVKLDNISEIKEKIYKISVYGKRVEALPDGIRVCYGSGGIYEYVNSEASKLRAASALAKSLSAELSDFIAFGDGQNDTALLKSCGMAFTTYCAPKDVFTTTDNHTRDVIGTVIRLVDEKRI